MEWFEAGKYWASFSPLQHQICFHFGLMTHGAQICQLCQPTNVLFHFFTPAAILASTCQLSPCHCHLSVVFCCHGNGFIGDDSGSGAPVLSTVSLCEGVPKGSPSMPMESRLHVRYVRMEVCMPKLPSTTESPCGQGPISLATSRLVLPYPIQKWYGFGSASAREGWAFHCRWRHIPSTPWRLAGHVTWPPSGGHRRYGDAPADPRNCKLYPWRGLPCARQMVWKLCWDAAASRWSLECSCCRALCLAFAAKLHWVV